jgi:hypothetical protein
MKYMFDPSCGFKSQISNLQFQIAVSNPSHTDAKSS